MLNASSLCLSLVGTPAEQLKSIIVFIDKLIAGCYETSHVLSLREHLVALDAKPLTAQTVSDLIWLEVNEALPPYLCFEKVGCDGAQLRVVPDFENMLEGTRPDIRYVQLVSGKDAWPELGSLDSDELDVLHFVRGWKNDDKVELLDCATQRVVWAYTLAPEALKAS